MNPLAECLNSCSIRSCSVSMLCGLSRHTVDFIFDLSSKICCAEILQNLSDNTDFRRYFLIALPVRRGVQSRFSLGMIFRHLTGSLRKHGRISKGVLERSSSTNLHEIDPRVSSEYCVYQPTFMRYYSFQGRERVIFTLDPSKFAEKKQQPLQIGDLQMFRPYIMLHSLSRFVAPVMAPRLIYDMSCEARTRKLLRYPPDTNAFLYYFTSPENPRIAGELRLRVTRSDNPESFESGFDLLKVNGQPWSRPLYVVAKCYYPLYKSLRGDQLVPDDLDAVVSTLPPISPRYRRRQLLYTLNDTFIVDFSNINRCFWVVTEHGTGVLRFLGPFAETRPTLCAPYTGAYTNVHLLDWWF